MLNASLSTFTVAVLGVVGAVCAGCSVPSGDEQSLGSSQAGLTSTSVLLEKSRIEVFLDQKNTQSGGECFVDSARFRVTYRNETLPGGTQVSLHAGESYSDQGWTGDGFGWA